jgi:hypothetical protein
LGKSIPANLEIQAPLAHKVGEGPGVRASGSEWAEDFALQTLEKRPMLEARYTSAARDGFLIEGQTYRLSLDLKGEQGHRIRSLVVKTPRGPVECLTQGGGSLEMALGGDAVTHSSIRAKSASRVNVYRRGPYFTEVHWLDVDLLGAAGERSPAKFEVVFYAYPEKVHVEIIAHCTENATVKRLALALPHAIPVPDAQSKRLHLAGGPGVGLALLSYDHWLEATKEVVPTANLVWQPDEKLFITDKWTKGERYRVFCTILPMPNGLGDRRALLAAMNPLKPTAFSIKGGGEVKYSERRGCYTVGTNNPGGFQSHFDKPGQHERAEINVRNDGLPRTITLCHETSTGSKGQVEAGLLLDVAGSPLPMLVQTSKNFSGENEEKFYDPGDPAYSETYFPLRLKSDESRAFTSLHLYQTWGNHVIKQVSSLQAWMDYLHMSAGVTETTCWVPFKFGGLRGVQIADMRPMSQPFWKSQPQHDNIAGHSFLSYTERGKPVDLEYLGVKFKSTGPNIASFTQRFLSEDGKVEASIDCMEMPQVDELRCFVRLTVDVRAPIHLDDAAKDLRLLTIRSHVQKLRQTHMAWLGESGGAAKSQIPIDGQVYSAALAPSFPWACVTGDKKGYNAFVVRDWRVKIGGKEGACGPAVAVLGEASGETSLMLTPNLTGVIDLKPGDKFQVDLILLPFGPEIREKGDGPSATPAAESTYYGSQAPRILSVQRGKAIDNFPTTVNADEKGIAEFTIRGGKGDVSVLIGNLPSYLRPRLYRKSATGAWQPVAQGSGEEGIQTFVDKDGKFGAVFVLKGLTGDSITLRALNETIAATPKKPAPKPTKKPVKKAARQINRTAQSVIPACRQRESTDVSSVNGPGRAYQAYTQSAKADLEPFCSPRIHSPGDVVAGANRHG